MTNKSSGTAAILTEVERTWKAIQRRHPDVPDVAVALASGRDGHLMKHGHFAAETWRSTESGDTTHELFLGAESLARGAQGTLCTLLHEAAHALAHSRGLQDTSRQGRYHNKVFASLAKDLGLTPPEHPSVIGFSDCTLAEGTVGKYTTQIARLDAALSLYRIARVDLPKTSKPGFKVQHVCASNDGETYTIAMGRKAFEAMHGLRCDKCAAEGWDPLFAAVETDDEDES